MPYCAAFGCNSRLVKGCGFHFFSFPKEENRCKQWIDYCKRADFSEAKPFSTICSKHFSRSQYERDPLKMAEFGYNNARPKLKDEAIPDIRLIVPAAEKKQVVIKRAQSDLNSKRSRPTYRKQRRDEARSEKYFFLHNGLSSCSQFLIYRV